MTTRKIDMNAAIVHIHSVFCAATGAQLRMGLGEYTREVAWLRFLNAGFTEDDMLTVVRYLQRKIREGTRNPGALKFGNLFERLECFEEELSIARATLRNTRPAPTPKERAIACLRPTVARSGPLGHESAAKPIGHYLKALREAAR